MQTSLTQDVYKKDVKKIYMQMLKNKKKKSREVT